MMMEAEDIELLVDFFVESNNADEVKRGLAMFSLEYHQVSRQDAALSVNMTIPFVDKWKTIYRKDGFDAMKRKYKGSQSYLTRHAQDQIAEWIETHETVTLAELRRYIQDTYDVVYQSDSSYYQFFDSARFSYKKTQAVNPAKDETQIAEKKSDSSLRLWSKR